MMIDLNQVSKRIEALEKRVNDIENHNKLLFEVIQEIYSNLDELDKDLDALKEEHDIDIDNIYDRICELEHHYNILASLFKIINLQKGDNTHEINK